MPEAGFGRIIAHVIPQKDMEHRLIDRHRFISRRCAPLALATFILTLFPTLSPTNPLMAQEQYRLDQGQWVKQRQLDPNSPEGQLQHFRRMIADGQAEEAWDALDDWIDEHPNHPMLVDAYLIRGDAKTADTDYYQALFDYEYVIRQYPGSDQFNVAIQREFEIAKLFAAGVKRRLWGMAIVPAEDEAEEVFIRIQERAPGTDVGESASLALGELYLADNNMSSAATAFEMFLVNYPKSLRREQALLRLIQSDLALFKGPAFDSSRLLEAATRIRQYQTEFPAAAEKLGSEALLARVDESMARKSYLAAQWYEQRGLSLSGTRTYQRLVKDYPRTAAAQDAIRRLKELGEPVTAPLPFTQPSASGGPRKVFVPGLAPPPPK